MTRVLVVDHDLDVAGQEADALRRIGYDVVECSGPTRNVCPVPVGRPCDLVDGADVLVYDVWASGDAEGARALVRALRSGHPGTPIVLTSPGLPLTWEDDDDALVVMLSGHPTGARLHEAIQQAMLAAGRR